MNDSPFGLLECHSPNILCQIVEWSWNTDLGDSRRVIIDNLYMFTHLSEDTITEVSNKPSQLVFRSIPKLTSSNSKRCRFECSTSQLHGNLIIVEDTNFNEYVRPNMDAETEQG